MRDGLRKDPVALHANNVASSGGRRLIRQRPDSWWRRFGRERGCTSGIDLTVWEPIRQAFVPNQRVRLDLATRQQLLKLGVVDRPRLLSSFYIVPVHWPAKMRKAARKEKAVLEFWPKPSIPAGKASLQKSNVRRKEAQPPFSNCAFVRTPSVYSRIHVCANSYQRRPCSQPR